MTTEEKKNAAQTQEASKTPRKAEAKHERDSDDSIDDCLEFPTHQRGKHKGKKGKGKKKTKPKPK